MAPHIAGTTNDSKEKTNCILYFSSNQASDNTPLPQVSFVFHRIRPKHQNIVTVSWIFQRFCFWETCHDDGENDDDDAEDDAEDDYDKDVDGDVGIRNRFNTA